MIIPNAPTRKPAVKTGLAQSLLLVLAAAALFASLAFPIWRITLDAPQYPEGMGMLIWARTLTGEGPNDLDIINQLNHYIGMKKIEPDAIPELKVIPPVIMAFGALCLLAAFRPRTWATVLLLAGLAAAGAAGMYDFWRWEYDYGHDLDPTAAIKVPGASYQPPLIGTAKLLNFHSSSWPALGGYLLFTAGCLLAAAAAMSLLEARGAVNPRRRNGSAAPAAPFLLLALAGSIGLAACQSGPAPFRWGEDACHHCKMTLVQKGFGAQRINDKGKVFTYDAIECLAKDLKTRPARAGESFYVTDFSRPDAPLLAAEEAVYLRGGKVMSPMGGSLAGFAAGDSALRFQERLGGEIRTWKSLDGG